MFQERADVAAEEGVEAALVAARGQCSRCHPAVVSPPTTLPSSIGWLGRLPLPRSPLTPTANDRWVRQTQPLVGMAGTKPTEITCPLPAPVLWCSLTKQSIACCGLSPHCTVRKSKQRAVRNGGRHPPLQQPGEEVLARRVAR
ncbi:unnamed protein product [Staurois parvus]|uniref:Uncharacterized protein n=1 Tax=Staurois parvus TaxID=386267 RepID=A0ABN9AAG2_9NEOB|nr:unnamed protein product [Staurois parvus]